MDVQHGGDAPDGTVVMDDAALLDMPIEELYTELGRLEEQKQELRAALRTVKHRIAEVRRVAAAKNAARRIDDIHLVSCQQARVLSDHVCKAEDSTFPAAELRLPYEMVLEIFSFLQPADLARSSQALDPSYLVVRRYVQDLCWRECQAVNRTWLGITNENLLWRHLVTRKWEKYSDKILNDKSSITEAVQERDWKQYLRWCASNNIRWSSHADYLTDCAEAKRQAVIGRKFLSRGNINAAIKALKAAQRLMPNEDVEDWIKAASSGADWTKFAPPAISGSRTNDESPWRETGMIPEWQCQHCTFINTTTAGICEMCALPRTI